MVQRVFRQRRCPCNWPSSSSARCRLSSRDATSTRDVRSSFAVADRPRPRGMRPKEACLVCGEQHAGMCVASHTVCIQGVQLSVLPRRKTHRMSTPPHWYFARRGARLDSMIEKFNIFKSRSVVFDRRPQPHRCQCSYMWHMTFLF